MGLLDRFKSGNAPTQKVQTAQDWCDKGDALAKSGRHEEALQCFDKALELDLRYTKAWTLKGAALDMLDRHERGAEMLRQGARDRPDECNRATRETGGA
jgi:pentatricopeptide repeat protein